MSADTPTEALRVLLERERVVAAWIFGSQTTGTAGPLSDLDLALLPVPEVGDKERLLLRGRVSDEAAHLWEVDHCDVVLVDEAPPQLAFEAIQGELVFDRDPDTRILAETRIQRIYHDCRHYLDLQRRWALEQWEAEGFAAPPQNPRAPDE